jgi:hypothetical protein
MVNVSTTTGRGFEVGAEVKVKVPELSQTKFVSDAKEFHSLVPPSRQKYVGVYRLYPLL